MKIFELLTLRKALFHNNFILTNIDKTHEAETRQHLRYIEETKAGRVSNNDFEILLVQGYF